MSANSFIREHRESRINPVKSVNQKIYSKTYPNTITRLADVWAWIKKANLLDLCHQDCPLSPAILLTVGGSKLSEKLEILTSSIDNLATWIEAVHQPSPARLSLNQQAFSASITKKTFFSYMALLSRWYSSSSPLLKALKIHQWPSWTSRVAVIILH